MITAINEASFDYPQSLSLTFSSPQKIGRATVIRVCIDVEGDHCIVGNIYRLRDTGALRLTPSVSDMVGNAAYGHTDFARARRAIIEKWDVMTLVERAATLLECDDSRVKRAAMDVCRDCMTDS